MKWTTFSDLKAQVQKLWDRGLLLAALSGGETVFPRRLTLKAPDSRELSERFPEVRDWISRLSAGSGPYRIEWRSVNHRVLGANEIPAAIWIDTLADALGLIGKRGAAEQFAALVELTGERQPELLDLVLSGEVVDASHTGVSGFCRRYGFLDKPSRVRFRVLDPNIRLLPVEADQDITLTQASFATLDLPVSKVFITENEINFLAFPDVSGAMVIFGAGYGFDNLAVSFWLHRKSIYYWGDIDTHGFAILNQLRGFFPHVASFLMDQQTLLVHRPLWGVEATPETGALARLTSEESVLYNQLRQNHWGNRVRLEQERIGFDFLRDVLRRL